MQNVNVQRKRNPGDTDKNGIISEYREILREAGCLSFFENPSMNEGLGILPTGNRSVWYIENDVPV